MPHIHEKIDFTVEVFIVHKNKVLLRVHDKFKFWLSIGGHIELYEDPNQAAIREVKEEVGLDIKIVGHALGPKDSDVEYLIPPKYLARHRYNATHEHITFVYFAKADTFNLTDSMSEHERAETRWVSIDELPTMGLRPNILFYATEALKELGKQ